MASPRLLGVGSTNLDTHLVTTAQSIRVGSFGVLDGRGYVWCSYTGSDGLTRGEPLVSSFTVVAQNLATSTNALSVGSARVDGISAHGAAIAAGTFSGGDMVVVDGGGEGTMYRIRDHTAFTASTADGVLLLETPIVVAGDANTEVTLLSSKFANPKQAKGLGQDPFVGVPNVTVPDGSSTTQYFWAQRVGYCPTFVTGTPKRGNALIVAERTDGRLASVREFLEVDDSQAGGGRTVHELDQTQIVGHMVTDAIDGEIQIVDLQNPLF